MKFLNATDAQYHVLMEKVLKQPFRNDRTGTGTKSLFGYQMRFDDIARRFPLLTTKKVPLRVVFEELRWMLGGDSSIKQLIENNCHLWSEWPNAYYNKLHPDAKLDKAGFEKAIAEGTIEPEWYDIGPCYGVQWRNWPVVERSIGNDPFQPVTWKADSEGGEYNVDIRVVEYDQLARVRNTLLTKPEDRRMIVNAWNAPLVDEMAKKGLPPCHVMYQFYTREMTVVERVAANGMMSSYRGRTAYGNALQGDENAISRIHLELDENGCDVKRFLDCQVYIRSNDLLLGAPFNMAQYALLTTLMAHSVGMVAGDLVYTIGDAHAYRNHLTQIDEQLSRESKGDEPQVIVKGESKADLKDYTWDDIALIDYEAHPAIKAPVAV